MNREVNGSGLSFPIPMLECCFTSAETVGLLGAGAQDVHLDFHTAPELCPNRLSADQLLVLWAREY